MLYVDDKICYHGIFYKDHLKGLLNNLCTPLLILNSSLTEWILLLVSLSR